MTRKQILPGAVLALCGVVVAYGFMHALSTRAGMPAGILIAAPAIVVGRFAWRRMWQPDRDAPRD